MKSVNAARWIALVAAFIMGAVAEWKLGLAVGLDQVSAALIPLTLDVWGYASFKTGRKWHVYGALAAMFSAQAVSHGLELGHAPPHMVALSVAVSAIAPGVSLACHRLGRVAETEPAAVDAPETVDAPEVAEATPEPSTVDTAPVTPVYSVHAAAERFAAEVATLDTEATPEPATAETVDAPEADTVDTPDAPMSKADIAARGIALKAELGTWKAAADEMGISRQWLNRCVNASGLSAVS